MMRGAVFAGDSRVELLEFPDPRPGPGEVVLQIDASGLCGSDLHTLGRPGTPGAYVSVDPRRVDPVIAGHEPVGTVVDRGTGVTDAEAPIGLRAVCFHYSGCGTCAYCRAERPQLCAETIGYGGTRHGGHAGFLVVPAATLVPLPDEVSAEAGACLACGSGTAFGALKRLPRVDGETIMVIGLGPVGASAVMLANAMGARVIGVDIDAARREAAIGYGAELVVDPNSAEIASAAREATDGFGVSGAIETSGTTLGRQAALLATRPEGSAVFVGLGAGAWSLEFDREVVMAPRAVIGSRTFSKAELVECVALVAERGIPIDSLVTRRYTLDNAQIAYDEFAAGGVGKHLIVRATDADGGSRR